MTRVLFVDDEPNVLEGIRRVLRDRVELHTATSGAEGLKVLADKGPFAVVVSDMRMPGMSGAQFLTRVRELSPGSVRMVLSGQADLDATIAAVNDGQIFRFAHKPCASEQLWRLIEAGLEQYRLTTAEKELLEKTLGGAIQTLMEILAMISPAAGSHAARLQRYVLAMVNAIGVADRWQLPLAALVSQIGCITLPKETLANISACQALSDEEKRLYEIHPEVAGRLLASIPRLEDVAAIVAGQRRALEPADRPPDLREWDTQSLGRLLLQAAFEFDRQVTNGVSAAEAADGLRAPGRALPTAVIEALRQMPAAGVCTVKRLIGLKDLQPGMMFDEDLVSPKGMRLVAAGQEATMSLLVRLRTIAAGVGLVEPFRVRVQA